MVTVGISPLDVHEARPGQLRPSAFLRRRATLRRWVAGVWGAAAALLVLVAGLLVLGGQGALGVAAVPGALALCWAALTSWRSGDHLAATVREGMVVPARARVLRGADELELDFVVAGRHPAWHQLFPPYDERPVTLMLHYELDGRPYLAVDVIEPGDQVACVADRGGVTPAVLVRRERPDRAVVLTEQILYARAS